ncbi:MAG: zinc ribbon domain-containing protein [Clostridia bacterium]|nr:zinc ribbon domain-containing protein [Clostridia bacterium]
MFCKNCGKEINDNAVVCPHCGVQVASVQTTSNASNESNTMAIIGFVFAFLMPLVGLICSIIGYKRAKNEGMNNKGLALAGIIISAIAIGTYVILFISIVAAGSCALAAAGALAVLF